MSEWLDLPALCMPVGLLEWNNSLAERYGCLTAPPIIREQLIMTVLFCFIGKWGHQQYAKHSLAQKKHSKHKNIKNRKLIGQLNCCTHYTLSSLFVDASPNITLKGYFLLLLPEWGRVQLLWLLDQVAENKQKRSYVRSAVFCRAAVQQYRSLRT